jgi:TP901 family phage tail tape measure protein
LAASIRCGWSTRPNDEEVLMPTLEMAIDARKGKKGAKEFEQAARQAARGADKADREVVKLDKSMDRLGKTGGRMGTALKTAFAGITTAVFLRQLTKTVSDYEQVMATVRGVTKATAAEFTTLSRQSRELGATTRFSAKEAAEGQLFLARAGFEVDQVYAALPHTLNLAAAGALDLGTAADYASNIVSQFNLAAEDTVRVADAMIVVSNRANTNVSQMAEAMKFAGPVAGALGIEVEEAAAAIGVLGDRGIQGTLAGTGLRMSLIKLLSPTTAAKKAIKELGLRIEELNPGTSGIVGVFEKFSQAQKDLGNNSEFATQMAEIFGARTAGAALIMTDAVGRMKDLREETAANAGETENMARIMEDTLGGSLKALKSAWEEILLAIGDQGAAGAIRDVVDTVTGALRILAGMEDRVTKNAKAAHALVVILKILAAVLAGVVIYKLTATILAFGVLVKSIWATVASLHALKAAFLSNPVGLIAVGVAALVAVIYSLSDATDTATQREREHAEVMRQVTEEVERASSAYQDFLHYMDKGNQQRARSSLRSHITELEELVKHYEGLSGLLRTGDPELEKARQLFRKMGLESVSPIQPASELQGSIGGRPARIPVPGRTDPKEIARVFESRLEALREQERRLADQVQEGAKAQRDMENAQRRRIDLMNTLDKLESELTIRIDEQNEALARQRIQREEYLRQAREIADAQNLDEAQRVVFLKSVTDQIDKVQTLRTQLDEQESAQRRATEAQRSQQAATERALETLDSLHASALRDYEMLEAQAQGNTILREVLEARAAAHMLAANASDVEKEALKDMLAELEFVIQRNEDLRKQTEARRQEEQQIKAAETSLESYIKQLERENYLLGITDEKERAVADARMRASELAAVAGKDVGEYADRVEQLVRQQQELQGDTQQGSNFANQFADQWSGALGGFITDMSSAEDSVHRLIKALADLAVQEFVLAPVKGFLQGIGGGLFGGAAQAATKPNALGDVFAGGPFYFQGPGGKLESFAESGAEAIMPLARKGGKLGVISHDTSEGGGGTINNFHMTVNTPDADSFRKSKRMLKRQLEVM